MKILELPVVNAINCVCGCKFEFDATDVISNQLYVNGYIMTVISVRCPFCNKEHEIKRVQQFDTNLPWY